jgi:anti-sigma regulatory factor (Ser/Thr protein kinase)
VRLEFALSLPRDHRSVPVARHLVRVAMLTLGVDGDCANDVEVALSEACTNVLRHGDPTADYEVRLQLDAERCLLRVLEVGRGAAGAFARESPGRAPAGEAEHGRGLLVMRALMDRVGFRLLPGAGSVVSLEKRLTYTGAGVSGGEPDRR